MKVTFFIDRPVFSAVLSIVIVLIGIIGLTMLPVDQYPQITPPVVKISASYPGASALTVSQAVATPIEQELNGTPGMLYMESSSSNSGGFSATVTFDVSADADLAAVEIQNRVKLAESRLPAEVIQNGISVEKQAPSQLMTLCLTSTDPKFDEIYLSNFATINVLDVIRRIPGVGRVSNIGSRYYAMQIWAQPDKLANFGLTVQDLQNALKDQNRESAAGVLGQQPVQGLDITIPITTQGRLSTVSQFENIVVRANAGGSIIRLKDVARISLEASSYSTESGINGGNAAVLAIYMLPGANAMDVARSVKEAMKEISVNFPQGLNYEIPFDMTTYISESIHEVYKTLFEALGLVVLVVYLSLQSWRATLIPVVAVPISLIGTFGFMLIFGFSLNILTLLGLILAIGIVVDDAIVVVEGVEHLMETEKLSPYEATKKAMNSLASALIATSLVLAAVFVPVSFLSGITGQLYRQFTVTIVVSVLISTVVALTLSPVMCSLILRPDSGRRKNIVFRKINLWLNKGSNKYVAAVSRVVKHPRRVMSAFGMVLITILLINRLVPSSFMPAEDQGYFTVELELPEGATLERTREVTDRAVAYLEKNPYIAYIQSVAGSSPRVGSNQGRATLTVILKPWDKRKKTTINDIMHEVEHHLSRYPECKVFLSTPPVIPGLGSSGGFEMQLEARGEATFDNLVDAADTLMYYASRRKELAGLSSSMQAEIPQLYFDVDRDKVKLLGVPLADVFSTMKAYTGSVYVNDFNMFNRIYKVYIQAEAPYREHKDNLNLFFVKASNGVMVPLTSLGDASYTTGPGSIKRFNMFTSTVIRGSAAHGYSSGQAMALMEQIAREHLPDNIGLEWSGLSYQEKKAGGQTGMVMALVFLFVFLFLAAQYESWTVPIAVLLSLPVAALGAYLGVWLCGLENDIYFQIGLVMLVGLAAKNAILIVEFAKEQVDKGEDLVQSAIYAARLRFRPILMTSLAFVLGMLPMVLASGPGSASRQAIGTGVFFGMIFAIVFGIILVPFFFVMVYKTKSKLLKQKAQ
ncbi:MAG: multidrug efflux RND transporter permease subunit [Mediterranea sp.]|jgi:hydrophobe/amphiphile efflux-1 (HAE1) family protein|nr:multidrug efflux RND transporter permease subunit [Mediterranea sp.]